jgi:predicted transcriptional regulator
MQRQGEENEEEDPYKNLSPQQLRALLKRSREEIQERDKRVAEEKQQRLEVEALVQGTFYLRIDELFEPVLIIGRGRLTENHYRNCCRNVNLHDVYQATVAAARKEENIPADDLASRSRSSMSRQTTNSIWPCTVFDPNSRVGEIAHLVPASVPHANSYWFVTDFLFGLDPPERSWDERRCLIHGSKPKNGGKRWEYSGIKHLVPNKINLPGQKFMDNYPCVLIVPIMDVDEAKRWKGESYDAIALIDNMSKEDISARDVAKSTFFLERGEEASPEEIEKAGELLQAYVKAIIFAQREKKPNELTDSTLEWAKKKDQPFRFYIPQIKEHQSTKESTQPPPKPVRKIHFVKRGEPGHPSPDPLLLMSRAASVWSRRHGQLLVAAAEPNDDYEKWDELDKLAAEQYLDYVDQQRQANSKPIIGLTIEIPSDSLIAPGLIHEEE